MQKNGEKFCPKCGTPYLSETGKDLTDLEKAPVENDTESKLNKTVGDEEVEKTDYSAGSSMLKDFFKYAGAFVFVLFLIKACYSFGDGDSSKDFSSDSYEQLSSANDSERAPSWIQGTWYCVTPYGNFQLEIVGDHIREFFDGKSFYGTYHIDGDHIIPETGSDTHYEMDKSLKRISAGQGYYFKKQ